MLEIKIKYFDTELDEITKIKQGEWIDLRARETVTIPAGGFKLIPLNVAMVLPEGYEAHVAARSSTFPVFGLIMANGIGIIDNTYSGDNDEWCFPAYATRNTQVRAGQRIAQFRIMPVMEELKFKKVKSLKGKNRGGFGSTGVE